MRASTPRNGASPASISATAGDPSAMATAKKTGSIMVSERTRSGRATASRSATVAPKEWPIRSAGS